MLGLIVISISYAGTPPWTFAPLTPTTLTVSSSDTAIVKYQVTNQSHRPHTLAMKNIRGIRQVTTPGSCPNPFILRYKQSCILNLTVVGRALIGNVNGGPQVCQLGSLLECYQPSFKNILNITKGADEYTVGGSIFGLQGTLVLQNDGDILTRNTDGTFTFPTALLPGSFYQVRVQTQPANQTCTVSNGTGRISNKNVTNVIVRCSINTRTVGGVVSGLSGSVVLQNNGADTLIINSNGGFTFPTPLAQGSSYNVTILTQPATQTCSVSNGTGTIGTTNITNVQITCATNAFTVGGTVSGLVGTVVLQNNATDDLAISSDGPFTFPISVAQGSPYNVTVSTQPSTQTCNVTNGIGIMGGANITNVAVNCVTNTTTLTTSVTDLALSVDNTGLNAALTGNPRLITITNTGIFTAFNLNVSLPTFPSGTSAGTTCGASLGAGDSCTITITPGNTATSNGTNPCSTGTAPVPGVVQVTADNSNTVSTNVVILSYGCIYQGGFLFSVDDNTSTAGSIGGKVADLFDDVGVNNVWATVANDTAADNITNGLSNTNALATPVGQYPAAQVCLNKTSQGFSDWFLPAICEMGYDETSTGSGCGTQVSPLLQNLYSNLAQNGIGGFSNIFYWSSTEFSGALAWGENFSNGAQLTNTKVALNTPIRCIRNLIP
ncbi:transmembrane protein [Legionella hackeliae]|nr:transmembrane protein [Legionella hackeliae]STX46880.1 transmembrane protein [Legionella hackeliae]